MPTQGRGQAKREGAKETGFFTNVNVNKVRNNPENKLLRSLTARALGPISIGLA